MKNNLFLVLMIAFCFNAQAQHKSLLVEAESFNTKGGRVVDQQFMDIMGSLYLMAHGWGNPVTDATTRVEFPDPKNSQFFPGEEFFSYCIQPEIIPYHVPSRCLYSRNIENLFMAGRNISVTHVAFGSVRVQRTTAMMGEVVGMAASVCKNHNALPRDVYLKHLDEMKKLLKSGIPGGNQ